MNQQIRRLMVMVIAMFLALMSAATYIQVFGQRSYVADPRNTRAIYNNLGRDRGPIIVAGDPVARSVPANDAFKYQRVYQPGALYALSTGYYSTAANSATGMERAADSVLSGTSPSLFLQRIQHLITGKQMQGGAVELTLDPKIQAAAAQALGDRRGAAVALDPKTGAILALYSSPSFDPNLLATHDRNKVEASYKALLEDPNKPLDNRAFGSHDYAPGSTFKVITAAAMLNSGKYKPDTNVDAPVSIPLPGSNSTLANFANETCGDGKPTLTHAFAQSCNTPFALAGMELGADKLRQMAKDFGFGESYGIPLQVTPSRFPDTADKAQTAMSAIGQYNVRVTPLQMATVAQTVANDGTRMRPYLVKRELNADLGVVEETQPETVNQPVSKAIANQLKAMMVEVINARMTVNIGLPGVQIAAKTGTAEVGDKGYSDGWLIGFAPADKPRIAFAVVVEGNQPGSGFGGAVAGPIALQMVKAAVQ